MENTEDNKKVEAAPEVEAAQAEVPEEEKPQRMLDLTCRFCGEKTGEYAVPRRFEGLDITPDKLGIVDSRCDACKGTHGTVQEADQAIEKALHDVGGATDELKKQMFEEAGWSAPAVIEAAQAEREKRIEGIEALQEATAEAEAEAKK